jgi:5-methylcytosine-specific restriction endonuclease McrBC GTP-binding regulatory subunit McrB
MSYQHEPSVFSNGRQRLIVTDLSVSETLGDSDTGSEDSFYARTTLREQEHDGYVPFHPSDRSPNAGLQNLGSVSA